eukprot:15433728-Alexandrium_andersonii.AAC.1
MAIWQGGPAHPSKQRVARLPDITACPKAIAVPSKVFPGRHTGPLAIGAIRLRALLFVIDDIDPSLRVGGPDYHRGNVLGQRTPEHLSLIHI